MKNEQKFSLFILIENTYSPPSFNIFQKNFVPIFPNNRTIYNLVEHFSIIKSQTLRQIISGKSKEKHAKLTILGIFYQKCY